MEAWKLFGESCCSGPRQLTPKSNRNSLILVMLARCRVAGGGSRPTRVECGAEGCRRINPLFSDVYSNKFSGHLGKRPVGGRPAGGYFYYLTWAPVSFAFSTPR